MTRRDVSLARYTTFGLGGPARFFISPKTASGLSAAVSEAARSGARAYLLGGGSNLLIHDAPLNGLVIANRIAGISTESSADGVLVHAGAGVTWDDLVARSVRLNLQGIECLSGIPGTVGAAPVQNIGAYGQSVADTLHTVTAVHMRTGELRTFTRDECAFGYRTSMFQHEPYIVTSVGLLLKPGGAPTLSYQDLAGRFSGGKPSLAQVRKAVLKIRASKGALAMRGYPKLRSAGSFFKNPVIDAAAFARVRSVVPGEPGGRTWTWPAGGGNVKVSAARLIESAGFGRGYREGRAAISPFHALVLTARRGACAGDVVSLASRVQERVSAMTGVLLEPEVRLWGWRTNPLLL
ncbi:MAG TPA: UDP-N-acetylmuramate dehydrogenase [Candidatus Paceibacterota bacterium]|nr:UDP-N-acetylmuramate dehydrogenase [Candidatus Paceibacterota bacterium]